MEFSSHRRFMRTEHLFGLDSENRLEIIQDIYEQIAIYWIK